MWTFHAAASLLRTTRPSTARALMMMAPSTTPSWLSTSSTSCSSATIITTRRNMTSHFHRVKIRSPSTGPIIVGSAAAAASSSTVSPGCYHHHHQYQSQRSYVSRAHPRPIPEFPINAALTMILEGIEERKVHRAERWERNKNKRSETSTEGPYRNQDETIECSLNMNVDPRRPGQALRGSILLPHGTGKKVSCLVFTADPTTQNEASLAGHRAGGVDLIDQILQGSVTIDEYQRALATKDVMPAVQRQLARLLGPRGLMPNAKTNTIFDDGSTLLTSLREQSNTITYRTDANGILHFALGKGSFAPQQLLDNMETICQTVQAIKPETYGRGKKKSKSKVGKNVKYWLRAHLTATHGKGSVRLDLRTVDPTSPFFMKEPE